MAIDPKQTRKARDLPECVPDTSGGKWKAPPGKPPVKCYPADEKVPELFTAPAALPTAEVPDRSIPESLAVLSAARTFRCSDYSDLGQDGDDVMMATGTEVRYFVWTSIPEITSAQLSYIASLEPAVLETITPASSVATLQSTVKLLYEQALFMSTALVALQTEVDRTIEILGKLALRCGWLSATVTVNCPAGALESPYPASALYAPNNPVVLPAGKYRSLVSQNDADNTARQMAQALLSCVWTNEEITRTCPGEVVPNSPGRTTPDGVVIAARVGTYTIPAGTLFSRISQQDANTQAELLALAALRCFYINEPLTVDCSALGKPDADPRPGGSVAASTTGNPILVEEGVIISRISTAAANAEATARAKALLTCVYLNEEQIVRCPDGQYGDDVVPASEKSKVISVIVPAGSFDSAVSVEDANDQARIYGEAQLQCLYCNPRIPPTCIEPSVLAALAAPYGGDVNQIPLPLVAPTGAQASRWSTAATLGVAAGAICGSSPDMPIEIGALIGIATPVSDECPYESDEIVVGCVRGNINSGGVVQVVNGIFDEAERTLLSSNSTPNPNAANETDRVIVIAAGFQTMRDEQVPSSFRPDITTFRAKEYANYLALQFGLGLLDCFYDNDAFTLTCELVTGRTGFASGLIGGALTVTSYAVAAGTAQSYESKAAANALAKTNATPFLTCLYANTEVRLYCADRYGVAPESSGSEQNPVVVKAGTYTSDVSQAEADAQALATAVAMLDCYYLSQTMTILCGAYIASPTEVGSYGSGTILGDSGDLESYVPVNTAASGSTTNPVELVYGYEQSYQSQEQANMRAFTSGLTYLNCFTDITAMPNGGAGAPPGGGGGGGPGEPGKDGKDGKDGAPGTQTGCDSKCLAYYS